MIFNFRQSYLFRLWSESKIGFIIICVFIFIYGFFFCKKMDMMIFPYNAMFAGAPLQKKQSEFYVVKVNGRVVPITQQFYWKKDMLEQSANHFANYQLNNKKVIVDEYLQQKQWPVTVKENLKKKLTPGNITFHQWAEWYLTKAGYSIQEGDTISLCRLKHAMQHDEISFSEIQVIEQITWNK